MPRNDARRIDWTTYGEARADFDRAIEGLETRLGGVEERIKETENRIIKRLDDQDRSFERGVDHQRDAARQMEERVRELEQELATLRGLPKAVESLSHEVTVLKTTNKLLAAGCTVMLTLMGLAIAWQSR